MELSLFTWLAEHGLALSRAHLWVCHQQSCFIRCPEAGVCRRQSLCFWRKARQTKASVRIRRSGLPRPEDATLSEDKRPASSMAFAGCGIALAESSNAIERQLPSQARPIVTFPSLVVLSSGGRQTPQTQAPEPHRREANAIDPQQPIIVCFIMLLVRSTPAVSWLEHRHGKASFPRVSSQR
ncbi:hypothetical protein MPH_06956 [Macrophomina phaseolina MS6]|uniref:Uncharacterized protein n=1 Tax=Macrophomina phaseolina (strain MS6) TaxID=1126212 RepID=K2RSV0_MACPH|nr:hypothetical protein MPH_06956 [Macrophomina phaseolina MS6]